jgi:histidine ammonia-lyase
MSSNILNINGSSLTIQDIVNVARYNYKVVLCESCKENIIKSNKFINDEMDKDNPKPIYGVTTGLGSLSNTIISKNDASELSRNMIISHAFSVGKEMKIEWVRAGMLVRANTLAKGYSGVKLETINTILSMLNFGITPIIPEKGSLACSGDLCLLSHIAIIFSKPIDGGDDADNDVYYNGTIVKGKVALNACNIPLITLGPKEGLALTNGSSFTAGISCLAHYDITRLFYTACGALSLSMEALLAVLEPFDERIHLIRPHEGQIYVAKIINKLIENSELIGSMNNVQDAYSIRCAPQVLGPLFDALKHVEKTLIIEINSGVDNPLIFSEYNDVLSGGNFHGQSLGVAIDYLKIPLAEIGALSERRIARLLDKKLNNGLPSMLCNNPGLNSGYMISQYTAAALVLDNQHLGQSDTLNSLPTCENQEDHNSNAMNAVRNLYKIIFNIENILAIEIVCAIRGIEFRLKNNNNNKSLGKFTQKTYNKIIPLFCSNERDHLIRKEINLIKNIILENKFIDESDYSNYSNKIEQTKRIMAIPRGFRDFHPHEMIIRKKLFSMITDIFEKHGAQIIETPVLELKEVLFGKYGEQNKLVFDMTDQGSVNCSMRYDLTVPFARYMALYKINKMKRAQISQVYRRDTPNISKGRYRAFYQCDFDIAGEYDLMIPDAEVIYVMYEILNKFKFKYTIKFNHKELLDLLLDLCNVPKDKYNTTCSSIDKLDKESWNTIKIELLEKGLSQDVINNIELKIVGQGKGKPYDVLANLRKMYNDKENFKIIFDKIELLFTYLDAFSCLGIITFDLSLCRGLDYYTGVIFEAIVADDTLGELGVGSIAGGGRYDNLIGLYNSTQIPAVGCSIGIERLFTIMEYQNKNIENKSTTKVFVTYIGNDKMRFESLKICNALWNADIQTEFLLKKCKVSDQIEVLLKKGIPYMIILGENEFKSGKLIVKDLEAKKQILVPLDEIVITMTKMISQK